MVTRSEAALDLNLLVEMVLMAILLTEACLLGGICLNIEVVFILAFGGKF